VLESLEREYRRAEEPLFIPLEDKRKNLALRIQKHEEQKEAFMKACSKDSSFSNSVFRITVLIFLSAHARGTGRNFLKVCGRASFAYQDPSLRSPETRVKGIFSTIL